MPQQVADDPVPQTLAVAQQVPLTQVVPAPQQTSVPPLAHNCALAQQAPATQVVPVAQHTSPPPVPQVWVPGLAQTPLHNTVPGGQTQPVQVLLGICPGMVQTTQVVAPPKVQLWPPWGQTHCPLRQLCPAGQVIPQPPQLVMSLPVLTQMPLQKVVPPGQLVQVHVPGSSTVPPVQLFTQVPLQYCVPLGQGAHWQAALTTLGAPQETQYTPQAVVPAWQHAQVLGLTVPLGQ